jgi:hypothetical protein
MSRWENEDVSDLNLPEPENIVRTYFDKNGNITSNPESSVAKVSECDEKKVYYVKYGRGELLDPHHIDSSMQIKRSYYMMKKVNQQIFESYVKFLQTKNRLYFTKARRLLMEKI